MESLCAVCGKNHPTGACVDQSRKEVEQNAERRLPGINKTEGRGGLKGLLNKDKKLLTVLDVLQMDAIAENTQRDSDAMLRAQEAETERKQRMYKRGPENNSAEIKEQNLQAFVATHEPWLIAKKDSAGIDTHDLLVRLGLEPKPAGSDFKAFAKLFYEIEPPAGWSKTTDNYDTEVRDEDGNIVLEQFFKGALSGMKAELKTLSPVSESTQEIKARKLPKNFVDRLAALEKMKNDKQDQELYKITIGRLAEMAAGRLEAGFKTGAYNGWQEADFLELLKQLGEERVG
ncbi:MAG TPA: hypothetical protein VLK22_03955 [Candidatus Udaeobacter sp.]|nr:hypothetical protein [Candidatus Udaeobacter sp.]